MIFMALVLLNNNKPDTYSHNQNDDCGSHLGVKEMQQLNLNHSIKNRIQNSSSPRRYAL